MDQSNFINYKKIKEKFDYSYKGYNLKFIIPGYLNSIFDRKTPSAKDTLKSFISSLEIINLRNVIESDAAVLITYLIERPDYKDLSNATKELYQNAKVLNIENLSRKKISPFSITYIQSFWLSLYLVWSHNIGKGIALKFYFIALSIKIFNQIKFIDKIDNTKIQKYICFNSAYREEAILTAYFNKRNIETISMQHGIFCDFKINVPFDIINEENFTAKKLLSWGQQTIDYLTKKGMESDRFILVGNPKYKNIKINSINQKFKKCLVLLGRGYYLETNNKLLKLLDEFNKTTNNSILFYIKKHPFLPDAEHKQFANINNNILFLGKEHSIIEILQSDLVDFSIAVNTTAYYESLALGKPSLRWSDAENEVFFGMKDKFKNIIEFSKRIEELKEMNPEIILDNIKKVTKYVFNPSLQ